MNDAQPLVSKVQIMRAYQNCFGKLSSCYPQHVNGIGIKSGGGGEIVGLSEVCGPHSCFLLSTKPSNLFGHFQSVLFLRQKWKMDLRNKSMLDNSQTALSYYSDHDF